MDWNYICLDCKKTYLACHEECLRCGGIIVNRKEYEKTWNVDIRGRRRNEPRGE